MKRDLGSDLKKLAGMAFGRLRHCGPLLKRFHALKGKINKTDRPDLVWNVYDWLLVPFMLLPEDMEGLAMEVLNQIEAGELDMDLWWLLEELEEPPPESTQKVVAEFERDVESGRYDRMSKQPEKFKEQERKVREDKRLAATWQRIRRRFEAKKFQTVGV